MLIKYDTLVIILLHMWFVNDPSKPIYPVVWTGTSLPCWQEPAVRNYHAQDFQITRYWEYRIWDMTPWNVIDSYQHFRKSQCLHLQDHSTWMQKYFLNSRPRNYAAWYACNAGITNAVETCAERPTKQRKWHFYNNSTFNIERQNILFVVV